MTRGAASPRHQHMYSGSPLRVLIESSRRTFVSLIVIRIIQSDVRRRALLSQLNAFHVRTMPQTPAWDTLAQHSRIRPPRTLLTRALGRCRQSIVMSMQPARFAGASCRRRHPKTRRLHAAATIMSRAHAVRSHASSSCSRTAAAVAAAAASSSRHSGSMGARTAGVTRDLARRYRRK
jgi:hypothetical protein